MKSGVIADFYAQSWTQFYFIFGKHIYLAHLIFFIMERGVKILTMIFLIKSGINFNYFPPPLFFTNKGGTGEEKEEYQKVYISIKDFIYRAILDILF